EAEPRAPLQLARLQGSVGARRRPELRLWVIAGARPAGPHALGHPRHRRRLVRRGLLRQLREARDSVRGRVGSVPRVARAGERAGWGAVKVDVEKQEVRFTDRVIKATVPDGPRNQLIGGTWDSTAVLLEAGATIEATAGKLPYVKGW